MMNRRSGGSMASTSSGFRLLDSDQNNNFDTISSISRNSIYKQKIDLMFDDSRLVNENKVKPCCYCAGVNIPSADLKSMQR